VVIFHVDANGRVVDAQFESGHPMLRATVKNAVSEWTFPKEAAEQQIKGQRLTLERIALLRLDDW